MNEWRFIALEEHTAAMNMALDQACMEAIKQKLVPPTIRLYRWTPSAVSIGYFQSLQDEIDIEECQKQQVDIVRRKTGGGAVYHDHDGEITYSVIAPVELFPTDINESYKLICGWIIEGLKQVGLECQFRPINDIIFQGKKISGNAQTRRGGILLQHGTILYTVDVDKMFSLLKVTNEKLRDKTIKNVKEYVTSIKQHKNITHSALAKALEKGLSQDKKIKAGSWTPQELDCAEKYEEEFASQGWNAWR